MFKKLLYGIAAVAAFTACTDDYTDWADPQSNAAEDAQTVTLEVAPVDAIDLAEVTTDSVQIFTATLTAEESATVIYELVVTNEDATSTYELTADADGIVSVEDLTATVVALYGQRPTQRTLLADISAYITVDGQAVVKTGSVEILVTPEAPTIESAYYLIGTQNSWGTSDLEDWQFNHSDEDVYDDPEFTLTVAAPTDDSGDLVDFWYKIVPESAVSSDDFWDLLLGSDEEDGDSRTEAGLAVGGGSFVQYADDNEGVKYYKLTLNMLDGTITVEGISYTEYIYMPGNPNGWDHSSCPTLYSPSGDGYYTGFGYLDGEFKFTPEANWNSEYNYSSFTSYSDGFSGEGTGNISFDGTAGYYYIVADLPNGTLTATLVEFGIVGPAQAGEWSAGTDMTYNSSDDCWEVTTDLAADEFKFWANDGWDINLGGDSLDDLEVNGANLSVSEAGTYTVKLYASRIGASNIYATLTQQ